MIGELRRHLLLADVPNTLDMTSADSIIIVLKYTPSQPFSPPLASLASLSSAASHASLASLAHLAPLTYLAPLKYLASLTSRALSIKYFII